MDEYYFFAAQHYLMQASAWSMLLWVFAYFLYPAALTRIEKIVEARLGVKVFGKHVAGVQHFVTACGISHFAMFAFMLTHDLGDPDTITVAIAAAALIIFLVGGVYSIYCAVELWRDVSDIANQLCELLQHVSITSATG